MEIAGIASANDGRAPVAISYRPIFLLLIVANTLSLILIGVRAFSYPQLVSLPGAKTLIAESAALLLVYLAIVAWRSRAIPSNALPWASSSWLGVLGGLLQCVHLSIERFVVLPPRWNGLVALSFMLGRLASGDSPATARREPRRE
ncbi:MAG TPA: hypothetical protein VGD59_02370 [Acidisarcina sp.]